ncbi:hypothetical protein CC1G_12743 [Coprinopsis cinerea okayama7|uniref:Uncharacterized protein n=1 Tax=Coprinopsis cinerea (strain Okayama-7 / 130 / ATCC MYA-4618 / FGSC 9003) TaxID=240176 RepID=A8NZA6_COPC7|nr:hypothetical protein CC1G_12743 [Coprinopsis cinerea okayama7\|eukprot:XP_001837638.2 hypothetical protein CC1G_12743 [Coprinopsis cinerea okayama7\
MIRTRRALRESGEELLEPQSDCGWPARTPSPVQQSRQGQAVGSSPLKSHGFPYVLVPPHPSVQKSTRPEAKSKRAAKSSKARGPSKPAKRKAKADHAADDPPAQPEKDTASGSTVAARRVSRVLTSSPPVTIAIADAQGRSLNRRSSTETIQAPSSPTTAIRRLNDGSASADRNKQPSYDAFDAELGDYGYEFAPYVEIPDAVRDALPDPVPGATASRELVLPPASRIPAPDEAVHFFYGRNWSCGAFSSSVGVLGRGRQGTRLARMQKYVTVFSWYNSQSKQCEQLPDGFTIPEPRCRISLNQLEESIYDAIRRNSDLLLGMERGLGVPRNGNPESPPGFRYSYVSGRPNEEDHHGESMEDEGSDIERADDRFSSPPAFDPAEDGDDSFGNWDEGEEEWEGCEHPSNGAGNISEQEPEFEDLPSSSEDGSAYSPSQASERGDSSGPGETANTAPHSSSPTRQSPISQSPPRLTAKQKGKGRAVDNRSPSPPAPAGPSAPKSKSQAYNPPPTPSFKRGRYDKDEKEIAAEMREWLEFGAKCCNRSPDSFLTLMGYPRTGEGLRKSQCWNKFRQWRKLQAENGEAEHLSQEEMFEIYNRDYKGLTKKDKEIKIQEWSADIERWDKKPVAQQDKEFLQLMEEAQAMMEKLSRSGLVEPILYFLATDPFYGRFTRVMVGNDIVQEMLDDGAANLRQILSAAAIAVAAAKTGTVSPKDAKLLQILGLHNASTNSSEAAVAADTSSTSVVKAVPASASLKTNSSAATSRAPASSSGSTSKRTSKTPGDSATDWGLYDPAAVKPDNVSQAAWDAEGKLPRDVFDWAELAQPGVLNVAKFWRQKQYETTVETVRDWGVRYMRFLLQVLYCQATGLKQAPTNGFYQGFADYLASNNKICEGWPPGCAVPDRDTKGSKALTRLWGSGAVELLDVAFGRKEGWTLRIIDFPPEAQAIERDDTDPAYLDLPLITCNDANGKVTAVKATVRDANAWHMQEVAAQTARRKWAELPPERRKPLEAASAVKKWPPKLRKTGRTVKVKKEEGVEPEEQDEDGEGTNLEEFDVEVEDGDRMDVDADENDPHHRDVVEPPRHPQPGPSTQSIPVYTGGDDDYYDADELFSGGYDEGGYMVEGEDQYMAEDFSNPEQYYDDQQQFNGHEIGRYHHRPNPQYTQTQHVSEYAQPLRATQTETHPRHLIGQSSRAFRPTLAPQRHPNVYPIHATTSINNPTPRVFSNPLPAQPPVRPTTHRHFTQSQVLDHVKDMLKIPGSPMKRKHQEQRMRPEGQSSRPASAVPWPSTRHAGGAHTLGQQGTRDDRPLKRVRVTGNHC